MYNAASAPVGGAGAVAGAGRGWGARGGSTASQGGVSAPAPQLSPRQRMVQHNAAAAEGAGEDPTPSSRRAVSRTKGATMEGAVGGGALSPRGSLPLPAQGGVAAPRRGRTNRAASVAAIAAGMAPIPSRATPAVSSAQGARIPKATLQVCAFGVWGWGGWL